MKKTLFILSLSVLAMLADAQIPFFNIGPKIGYNTNKLTTEQQGISSSMNDAFQFGAFVRLGRRIYFQPEAIYLLKGGVVTDNDNSLTKDLTINLKTISVPVLVGAKLISKGPFNLRVMGGPTMSFVIDKELKPSEILGAWPIKSEDDIRNSIWTMQLGAGVDLFFLTLDVRYEFGMDNLYEGTEDFSLKNNTFNVSLGVKLL